MQQRGGNKFDADMDGIRIGSVKNISVEAVATDALKESVGIIEGSALGEYLIIFIWSQTMLTAL